MKMSTLIEGEILLKEQYGNGTKERFYVKTPEQLFVTVLDKGKKIDIYNFFKRVFLPHGYPHSVSKDYVAYQLWDTAQAFCSTITGTLATQEVLRGVGVGDYSATPLAATVTWVIKDGCGHIGRILFAFTHGTHLDAYSKKWRLYADVLNDAAMCIEISLPLFKNYTTFALCVSTTMKAIVGVAGGATRAALTQHHALRGNLADVSAKDAAQETAVNLVASFTALLLITVFGNSVSLFLFTMVLHVTFNYLAVRAVCLRTLNEPRYLQVISAYVVKEIIPSPCEVNRNEPVVYQMGHELDSRICGFRIKLGCSLKLLTHAKLRVDYLIDVKSACANRKYLLCPNIRKRQMYVLLREEAGADDTLCAYFHAVLLSIVVCAINGEPLLVYEEHGDPRPFARVCHTLQAAEWSRVAAEADPTAADFKGFLYEPSLDLMKFLDNVVQREWRIFRAGLIRTGWDMSKHLLLSDEWRVSYHALESIETQLANESEDPMYPKTTDTCDLDYPITDQEDPEHKEDPFIIEPEDDRFASATLNASNITNNLNNKSSSLRLITSHLRLKDKSEEKIGVKENEEFPEENEVKKKESPATAKSTKSD